MYRFIRFPEGKGKAVTLSYDDGVKSDIRLCEIFAKHGMKCTFNIPSNWIGLDGHLSGEEIKELFAKGNEIAVHCANHRAPGQTRVIEGIKEVLQPRSDLEALLGCIIRGMAYPNSGMKPPDRQRFSIFGDTAMNLTIIKIGTDLKKSARCSAVKMIRGTLPILKYTIM